MHLPVSIAGSFEGRLQLLGEGQGGESPEVGSGSGRGIDEVGGPGWRHVRLRGRCAVLVALQRAPGGAAYGVQARFADSALLVPGSHPVHGLTVLRPLCVHAGGDALCGAGGAAVLFCGCSSRAGPLG